MNDCLHRVELYQRGDETRRKRSGHVADRKIYLAVDECRQLAVACQLAESYGGSRVLGRERLEKPWTRTEVAQKGNAQWRLNVAYVRTEFLGGLQELGGALEQSFASLGKTDTARASVEQLHAKVALEDRNVLGERWPGEMQPLSRPAEVQLSGDGHE
jgi:hypothetical protein